MKICENCLHADVCGLHEDNFMADAIKNGFCGKFQDKNHYIYSPCKIGDIILDKEGNFLKVIAIKKNPKDISLQCICTDTGSKKTICIGKNSIGKNVFLSVKSFVERQAELNNRKR